jgi:hypothetical protein
MRVQAEKFTLMLLTEDTLQNLSRRSQTSTGQILNMPKNSVHIERYHVILRSSYTMRACFCTRNHIHLYVCTWHVHCTSYSMMNMDALWKVKMNNSYYCTENVMHGVLENVGE